MRQATHDSPGTRISHWLLSLVLGLGLSGSVSADETDAKNLLKAMSDYMAAQTAISFDFDATLEVVTNDDQKLALVSSGTATLSRPNKIRVTRAGGFADVEMLFDGTSLTLFGKNANLYTQIEMPGTLDQLVDQLQHKYYVPLPAADLLLSNVYDALMAEVIDVKDLGSGVVDGMECDYLAFRNKEVDWQIWIAQGENPYPCRYAVTSRDMPHSPQYVIQVRDWKTGSAVAADDFVFTNTSNATKVDIKDLKGMDSLPDHFSEGAEE